MDSYLLAVGSNVGDSRQTIENAADAIDRLEGTKVGARSDLHRTRPIGGPQGQDDFLNGAMVIETGLPADSLLLKLHTIETRLGRKPGERWSARTIDLDILLSGDQVIESDHLSLPHPRMTYRPFVLGPAVEVAGDWQHPLLDTSLDALWTQLQGGDEAVRIYGGTDAQRRWHARQICGQFVGLRLDNRVDTESCWLSAGDVLDRLGSPKLAIQLREQDERPLPGLPTLRIPASSCESVLPEVVAAIEGIWPDLGRAEPTG